MADLTETILSAPQNPAQPGTNKLRSSWLTLPRGWDKAIRETINDHHASVGRAIEAAAKFCALWFANDKTGRMWLVLGGNTGVGKTAIATRARNLMANQSVEAWENGGWPASKVPSVMSWSWPYYADSTAQEWELCARDAETAHCLILDDIGAESNKYKSTEPITRLLRILEARKNRFTIFTTNIPRNKWKDIWDQRISDRLMAAGYVSLFDVPSFRLKT